MKKLVALLIIIGLVASAGTICAGGHEVTFDDTDFTTFRADEYLLEGDIPIGNTLKVDGVDAEIYGKFQVEIPLLPPPSYTPAEIQVTGKDGFELESYTLQIENYTEQVVELTENEKFMTVDGKKIPLQNPGTYMTDPDRPSIGRFLIPIGEVAEAMGAKTSWDAETETLTITTDSNRITLKAGESFAKIGGLKLILERSIALMNGSIFVPYNFMDYVFDDTTSTWDSDNSKVRIRRELVPDNGLPFSEIDDEQNLKLEEIEPAVFKGESYIITGTIPLGATVKVNGDDVEVFHRFRSAIPIKSWPSENPVTVEVFDESGKIISQENITIYNKFLFLKVWVDEPRVEVNNENIRLDADPVIVNNRVMVPFRMFVESFRAMAEWVAASRTLIIRTDDIRLEWQIGSKTMNVNGEEKYTDVEAQIIGGRTMLPLRFVCEAFEADVNWDKDARAVRVIK